MQDIPVQWLSTTMQASRRRILPLFYATPHVSARNAMNGWGLDDCGQSGRPWEDKKEAMSELLNGKIVSRFLPADSTENEDRLRPKKAELDPSQLKAQEGVVFKFRVEISSTFHNTFFRCYQQGFLERLGKACSVNL